MRRLILLAAAILVLALPAAAPAEILSAYVTYSPLHATSVSNGTLGGQPQYTDVWAHGIGGGVTVNFLPLPIVSLGLDLRGSTKSGTPGADTGMVGIKLGVHPPATKLHLYVEGAGGYLAVRTPNVVPAFGNVEHKDAAWEILGGIDYPIMHFINYRIIEVGGGKAVTGDGPSILTINTGIVLHF